MSTLNNLAEDNHQHDFPDLVILLHGLKRRRLDMKVLERNCRKEGYETINWGYPSTKFPIGTLAEKLAEELKKHKNRRIHFITHSMGGIIVRMTLNRYTPPKLGRIVMIAPPGTGAHLADFFGDWKLFKFLFGPAGQDLRRGECGVCDSIEAINAEFGVIAGGRGNSTGFNPFLPGDNDGTVTVESTHLPGEKDFILLPYMHLYIHIMPRTVRLALSFLRTGAFRVEVKTNNETPLPNR